MKFRIILLAVVVGAWTTVPAAFAQDGSGTSLKFTTKSHSPKVSLAPEFADKFKADKSSPKGEACGNNEYVRQNDLFYKGDGGTTHIENQFYNENMVQLSFNVRDNRQCKDPKFEGAFLNGINQGLSGERFAVFYQSDNSTLDPKTQELVTDMMACVEYGTPRIGKKLDWQSLLDDQKLANMTLEFRATYAKQLGATVTDVASLKAFRAALNQEIQRLKGKENGPDMDIKKVLNDNFGDLQEQQKFFRCCMAGFNSGFGYLQNKLEAKSDSVDCSNSQSCKQDYAYVYDQISAGCGFHKCETCELSKLIEKDSDKKLHLGCASAGYVSALTDPAGSCEYARTHKGTPQQATATSTVPIGQLKPDASISGEQGESGRGGASSAQQAK